MRYNGVEYEVKTFKSGKKFFSLKSPVNGTQRLFEYTDNGERLMKNYIDNAVAIDSHSEAMARRPW